MSFGATQAAAPTHNPNNGARAQHRGHSRAARTPAHRHHSFAPLADVEVPNAATDGISCVAWSPASNHIVAGSWDNQIRCWEVQANGSSVPKAAISHEGPVLCASWTNDGTKVYTGSCDKTAKIWDLATSQATQCAAHDQPIKNIFWVQEMSCVVTASWDKTIK